jgi:hypothetical protein
VISPDLVRVRKRNGVLSLAAVSADASVRARALAEQVLAVLSTSVKLTRIVVEEELSAL